LTDQSIKISIANVTKLKIDQKASAVLEAAVRVFAAEGLEAPISTVAREAGVAHGSVFHHFKSKANLINATYLYLKEQLHVFVFEGLSNTAPEEQLHHVWSKYIAWNVTNPVQRQALARLSTSREVTAASQLKSLEMMKPGVQVIRRAAAAGVLRDEPDEFLFGIVQALSEATINAIESDPGRSGALSDVGYHVLRQAIT
jgi:AcrR family transcriptional regulator